MSLRYGDVPWHDRTHFFAIALRIMRRLLVDHARGRMAQKRGPDAPRVVVSEGHHWAFARAWLLNGLRPRS